MCVSTFCLSELTGNCVLPSKALPLLFLFIAAPHPRSQGLHSPADPRTLLWRNLPSVFIH